MAIYIEQITDTDRKQLEHWLLNGDDVMSHRARVVLLSHEGYRIPEIAQRVDAHPTNLRKWIHRYNDKGPRGLVSPRSGGAPVRITDEKKAEIIGLAQKNPRALNLPYSRWTLHKLVAVAEDRGIVESISHEYVRQILLDADVDYREINSD